MANQVINREPWLDTRRLIVHLGCSERWIEYGSRPQQARSHVHRGRLASGDARRRNSPRLRGLRGDGTRGIEAMGAEREDEAKP
jgi:hypothetical protein